MFICVVRVVGGSTRKGQSRVERGNIFPTFTRRQQAGPGLVTRQRGKLCVGSAKDVCHITWPRDVPPVATPTTINMHRRVETGVQITSHYITFYITALVRWQIIGTYANILVQIWLVGGCYRW